ncbi:MAG TPA: Uma2 family endonuclease [Chloroflexota bacterium]|nr:Uma2 family endonuclease [Chloroflexota bacterium]HUM72107.1 Uma2 family endonuclease [Chloroflexota bacterium]
MTDVIQMVLEPEVIEIPIPEIDHLITEDDTPVDNIFSEKQQRLLTESLYTSWQPSRARPFVALANVGMFYTVNAQAIMPDVLVSLGVELPADLWEKKHRSYFIWEYGKPPDVVVEIVSNRQGGELTRKKQLYAELGIAYYIVYDPGLHLSETSLYVFERRGAEYVQTRKTWLPKLGLGVQLWEGVYEEQTAVWLRWCDQEGNLIPTGAEAVEQERNRAEKLAEQLRALGIEPEA